MLIQILGSLYPDRVRPSRALAGPRLNGSSSENDMKRTSAISELEGLNCVRQEPARFYRDVSVAINDERGSLFILPSVPSICARPSGITVLTTIFRHISGLQGYRDVLNP